jgi:hypothetical protein
MQFFIHISLYLFLSFSLFSWDRPAYKIVIDPGHGGTNQKPTERYGDKFDTISGKYLEPYKPGAGFQGREEREIVLELALELQKILDLTRTNSGFKEFQKIASHYTKSPILPVRFESVLTRKDNFTDHNFSEEDDKNALYRMYDYIHPKTGEKVLGRLSIINSEKPELVVSLHLNPSYPGHEGGMAAVIAPPYRVFQQLRLISNGKLNESVFYKSPFRNWLKFKGDWNHLENAIADTWIYFHGYWPDQSGKNTDLTRFSGYRHNMVTWRYADSEGWEKQAVTGGRGQYAKNHSDYIARGKFWNRERGLGERFRRDRGPEGFGGDNLYASNELLRFVHFGLSNRIREQDNNPPKLGPIQPPYISTYSLPTYTNAIVAFLEIGYIDNERDMKYIIGEKRIVAESLAVGIYSLFMGTKTIKKSEIPYTPKGKKIGIEKYQKLEGKNYFKIVTD